jgi:arylsulfatase A-like enzyme
MGFPRSAFTLALALPFLGAHALAGEKPDRPNILWITSEDNSPFLGCYGDPLARTPNMDTLAKDGILYLNAFANAPICAPMRSTIITGCYSASLGTQPMRSGNAIPAHIRAYSEHLRKAGYYCTNNSKTDYNTASINLNAAWDECSNKAHWKNRAPGQPFFAIFNTTISHESGVHKSPATTTTDPAKIKLPDYHPDTPLMRRQWALYYDNVAKMDGYVGERIQELKDAGLLDETIVFYYADHGGVLPRSKRFIYESGTHVPLLVRFPAKYRHLAPGDPGTKTDRLVSFVDLPPSLLSLAGAPIPEYMQGEAFLGPQASPPREYVYLFRDRADERPDAFRAVRDKRFRYIRNYYPHMPYGVHIDYLWKNPATAEWDQLFRDGKLDPVRSAFFLPRAQEELYDVQSDPHEVKNLAADPAHRETLDRLRNALREWQLSIRDTCLLPEPEMMRRAAGSTIFEMMRDPAKAPNLERLMEAADLAGKRDAGLLPKLTDLLKDKESGVRYWGAVGLLALGDKARPAAAALQEALKDECASVQVTAAQALLCNLNAADAALPVLREALSDKNDLLQLMAANALDYADEKARPLLSEMQQATKGYVGRVMEKAVSDLKGK